MRSQGEIVLIPVPFVGSRNETDPEHSTPGRTIP
jgi:hypothetical protein